MINQTNLFVIRKVLYDGLWHLRCIDLGSSKASEDVLRLGTTLRLSNREYRVTTPNEECETSGVPLGPLIVYGADRLIESIRPEDRVALMVAQNVVVVVTQDDCAGLELYQFLTDNGCECSGFRCAVHFEVTIVDELPDCVREAQMIGDQHFSTRRKTPITAIPAMLPLPGSMRLNGYDVPVVYQIREWTGAERASMDLFLCGGDERVVRGQILERKTWLKNGTDLTVPIAKIETARKIEKIRGQGMVGEQNC
jgi:hypothetical protein